MIYPMLYDWQKEIVDSLAKKPAFGLWLDCGLGKTVQALALAEKTGAEKILIITPNAKACESITTSGSWQQWATKLGPEWVVRSKGDKLPVTEAPVKEETKKSDDELPAEEKPKKKNRIGKAQVAISSAPLPKDDKFPKAFKGMSPAEKTVMIVNYESLFCRGTGSKRPVIKDEILSFINNCYDKQVTLLIDESHYIKDPQSQQTQVLQSIKRELMVVSKYLHIYLLTGTPFTRGFIDVWNQLKFMGCQMTKTEFRDRFCVLGNVRGLLGWQQPIVGYKNIDGLYQLIHQYAITLKSDDVLKLPEQVFVEHVTAPSAWFTILTRQKLRIKRVLELNAIRENVGLPTLTCEDLQRFIDVWAQEHGEPEGWVTLDKAIEQNLSLQNPWFRNIDFPDTKFLCDTPGSLWLRARQLSIGFQGNAEEALWYSDERLQAIKRLLEEKPDNYVLFYNYTPEFTELFDICYKLGYNIDVYNGEIKSMLNYERYIGEPESERLVDNKNIIIANFASGSTGMNWQEYSQCIIASLPTYKHWAQGLKRVHRNGSKSTVFYHVFKSSSWLDDGMWEALENKVEYSDEMFNKALNEAQI